MSVLIRALAYASRSYSLAYASRSDCFHHDIKKLMRHLILVAILILTSLVGCATMRNTFRQKQTLPTVWNQTPTLDDVVGNLKRQSGALQSISTSNATLTVPGAVIPLQSSVYAARPRSIRIRGAASAVTGQEIDFGSNNEQFWFWGKRLAERELYTARHDQFATSPARASVPIDPDWLMEAIGFLTFDGETYEPLRTTGTTCELVSRRQTPAGVFVKRLTIDAKTGCVTRQEMYDAQSQLLAVAESSQHRIDPTTGIVYPQRIEVQSRGATGKITLDLGTPVFNVASSLPPAIFVKPVIAGYTEVDLCAPPAVSPQALPVQRPATSVAPQVSPTVSPPPTAAPNIASGQTYTVVQ
ncbi:MAG: hypothetical protein ACRC46_05215 [Thermoguttaceae bacterium]